MLVIDHHRTVVDMVSQTMMDERMFPFHRGLANMEIC